MLQIVLIGLGAGATSAILFASVTSGVLLSIILFDLAPLPILIAALGWSHWAGLVAALTSAVLLGIMFGPVSFMAVLIGVAAPAWWLGYLALLARPTDNGAPGDLDWYPPGRLVVWAAVLAAVAVTAALANFGGDEPTIRAGLKNSLTQTFRLEMGLGTDEPLRFPGVQDVDRLLDLFVLALPPIAAVLAALTQTGNLWLAGQVVKLSGRLKRPWPDLTAMSFPPWAAGLLAATVAGSFIPDLIGLIASLFASTLIVAFTLLGFAVLHAMTAKLRGRIAILTSTYAIVAVFGWPALIMSLVGLSDCFFDWRARKGKRGPPVTPPA
jgi:hypothetical protein